MSDEDMTDEEIKALEAEVADLIEERIKVLKRHVGLVPHEPQEKEIMSDEDTEFLYLEQRIKRQEDQKVHEYLHRAQVESVKFCEAYANDLPLMTLRKAFELGFRTGYSQGEKK